MDRPWAVNQDFRAFNPSDPREDAIRASLLSHQETEREKDRILPNWRLLEAAENQAKRRKVVADREAEARRVDDLHLTALRQVEMDRLFAEQDRRIAQRQLSEEMKYEKDMLNPSGSRMPASSLLAKRKYVYKGPQFSDYQDVKIVEPVYGPFWHRNPQHKEGNSFKYYGDHPIPVSYFLNPRTGKYVVLHPEKWVRDLAYKDLDFFGQFGHLFPPDNELDVELDKFQMLFPPDDLLDQHMAMYERGRQLIDNRRPQQETPIPDNMLEFLKGLYHLPSL